MTDSVRPCPSCGSTVTTGSHACPTCGALASPQAARSTDVEALVARIERAVGDRYRIERELGHGGMAMVFLAEDLRHHRQVAIKVLRPELSPLLGAERFLREIQIAASLHHPHIVPLHDSGEADGMLFFVMPFVDGASLRQRIAREGGLPVEDVVGIAREVADGLSYAHALGVVHRDIKPENILLTQGHAEIADFGIARALHASGAGGVHTTGSISLGTPHYMSPEQLTSDPSLDHRTDIYSLGCTMFEMLTGRPPFSGPGPAAIAAKHLSEPAPVPSAVRAGVPAELDAVVLRAMAKDPAARYATAGEIGAALAPLAASSSGPVAPPRFPRRRRTVFVATTGLLAVLAAGAALITRDRVPPPAPPAPVTMNVVVMPFEGRSDQLRPIAVKLTEDLTNRLISVATLSVPGSAAVRPYQGATFDSLRAHFHADRFVLGRVESSAPDSMRVTIEMLDGRTGRGLPGSSFVVSRSGTGPDSASARLSLLVRHALWNDIERAQRKARVRDSTAWRLVELARDLSSSGLMAVQARQDRDGFRMLDAAELRLSQAKARDGTSDLIPVEQARVAEMRAFIAEYLLQRFPNPPSGLNPAGAERRRALRLLDPLIAAHGGPADALELRGRVHLGLARELRSDSLVDLAIEDFKRSTELDLHRATAWKELGAALKEAGRFPEALLAVDRAFQEDAFQLHRVELLRIRFDAALRAEAWELAAESCRAWLRDVPMMFRTFDCEIQLWSRRRNDAPSARLARLRDDSLRAAGDSVGLTATMRGVYVASLMARAGLGQEADARVQRLVPTLSAEWRSILTPELAYYRLLRGDSDSAAALIVAANMHDPTIRRVVLTTPWLAPLRLAVR